MPDGFSTSEASDLRFQFEVIKTLSDSLRQTVSAVDDLRHEISEDRKAQSAVNLQILERLARIESNKVNEEVADLKGRFDSHCTSISDRVDKLERTHDYEEGMRGARKAVMFYWPAFAALAAFVLLLLIATGIVSLPDTQKAPVVVPVPAAPTVRP